MAVKMRIGSRTIATTPARMMLSRVSWFPMCDSSCASTPPSSRQCNHFRSPDGTHGILKDPVARHHQKKHPGVEIDRGAGRERQKERRDGGEQESRVSPVGVDAIVDDERSLVWCHDRLD